MAHRTGEIRRSSASWTLVLLLLLAVRTAWPQDTPPPTPKKSAPPEAAALKEADKLVREIYKAEYGRTSPADVKALAQKLLDKEPESRADLPASFVLLREARDLAASVGDVEIAFGAIDRMDEVFQIDAPSMKVRVLEAAARRATAPDAAKAVGEAFARLVEDLAVARAFESAKVAAQKGEAFAKSSKQPALAAQMKGKAAEIDRLLKEDQELKAAQKTLLDKPDDPAANQAVGRFLCLGRGAWDEGLPYLAKAADPALQDVAKRDLSKAEIPQSQIEIAEAWMALGAKAAGPAEKKALNGRAAFWFGQALPNVTGLTRLKLEKRLEELSKAGTSGPSSAVDLLKVIDPKTDAVAGEWTLKEGTLACAKGSGATRLQVPYTPPEEYDLELVVERADGRECLTVGLVAGGSQFVACFDGWGCQYSGLHMLDGKYAEQNDTTYRGALLADNKPSTVSISVRKGGVTVLVDGKKVVDWKGAYSRLASPVEWQVKDPKALFLGAWSSAFKVTRMTLTPKSGPGKSLR